MLINLVIVGLIDAIIASILISISYLTYRASMLDRRFLSVSLGFLFIASGVSIEALIISMVLAYQFAEGEEIDPFVYKYDPFWLVSSILIAIGFLLILSYYLGRKALYSLTLLPIKALVDLFSCIQAIIISSLSFKQNKYSGIAYSLLGISQLLTSLAYISLNINLMLFSAFLKLISFVIILVILLRA